ncbi:hypothetical protein OIO90_000091 [Microbotryomycetes sp. JL221]|nr:hypothetical protein OIO90_000091 [Microbotryomycetes sp. JL221]
MAASGASGPHSKRLNEVQQQNESGRDRSSSLHSSLKPLQVFTTEGSALPTVQETDAPVITTQQGRPRAGTFPSTFHLNPAASTNHMLRQLAGGMPSLAPPSSNITATISLPSSGRTTPLSEIPLASTLHAASLQGSGSTSATSNPSTSSSSAALDASRMRAGSLTLSTAEVSKAFESTVFPTGLSSSTATDSIPLLAPEVGTDEDGGVQESAARAGLLDDLRSPESSTYAEDSARTLDFLGLDSDTPVTGFGPFGETVAEGRQDISTRGLSGRSSSVSATLAPPMQRLGSTGSLSKPKLTDNLAYQARMRSNTVAAFGRAPGSAATHAPLTSSYLSNILPTTSASLHVPPTNAVDVFGSTNATNFAQQPVNAGDSSSRLLYSTSAADELAGAHPTGAPLSPSSRTRAATVNMGMLDDAREVTLRRRAGTATGITPFAVVSSLQNGNANGYESSSGDFAGVAERVLSRNMRGLTLGGDEQPLKWNSSASRSSPPDPSNPSQAYQQPTRSLWIGNLDPRTSPAELQSVFAPYGAIESLRLIPEKECGFVNFVSVQDAIKAKDDVLNRLGGHLSSAGGTIRIGFGKDASLAAPSSTLAYMRTTAGPVLGSHVAPPTAADANLMTTPTRALWIGSIPATTTPNQLLTLFAPFGPIESARVLTHKSCGFINFERLEDAVAARKALNGRDILGSEIGAVRIGFAKVPAKVVGSGGAVSDPTIQSSSHNDAFGLDGSPFAASAQDYRSNLLLNLISDNTSSLGLDNNPMAGDPAALATATAPVDEMQLLMRELTADAESAEIDVVSLAVERPPATYYSSIPLQVLNDTRLATRYTPADTNRLKDLRRQVDSAATSDEIDSFARELVDEAVGLSSDYIGNTIIQKIFEKASLAVRKELLQRIAPHLAAIGTHKNGTWAAQKIIACAQEPEEYIIIAENLAPFAPPLLLNDFGNYVVQGCLRFKEPFHNFIFDAMVDRCWEIGSGRFGARSMRQTLESDLCGSLNLKRVAIAIILNSIPLATNANGALLITWLLDTSDLPGRFKMLAARFAPHLVHLCTHKLAIGSVIKILSQREDPAAAETLMNVLLDREAHVMEEILADQQTGASFASRLLSMPASDGADYQQQLSQRLRDIVSTNKVASNTSAYRRLVEELGMPWQGPAYQSSPSPTSQRQREPAGGRRPDRPRQSYQNQSSQPPRSWQQQQQQHQAPYAYNLGGLYANPTYPQNSSYPGPYVATGYYGAPPGPGGYYGAAYVNSMPGSPPPPMSSPYPMPATTAATVNGPSSSLGIGFSPFSPLASPTAPQRFFSPNNLAGPVSPINAQGY